MLEEDSENDQHSLGNSISVDNLGISLDASFSGDALGISLDKIMWPDNDTYDFQLFEPEDTPIPTACSVSGTVCPRTHLCFPVSPRQILKRMS